MTSVPLHTFTGVIMGYFVGIARFAPTAGTRNGAIRKGFIAAYLIHAVYDTFVLSATAAALLIIPLVIALFVFGVIYLKKGAAMSARRWNVSPAEPAADKAPIPIAKPAAQQGSSVYKVVVSRILFALCAGFWALLAIAMVDKPGGAQGGITDIIAGGIIITIVPVFIGIILEISYHRHRRPAPVA
jgi:hypothetical protein